MKSRSNSMKAGAAATLALLAGPSSSEPAGPVPQAPQVRCEIRVDADTWVKGQPGIVRIALSNSGEGDLELAVLTNLELSNAADEQKRPKQVSGRYWGPLDLTAKAREGVQPVTGDQARVTERKALQLKIPGRSKIEFSVDAAAMEWASLISPAWPHQKLFEVVPNGAYRLRASLSANGHSFESNAVSISIKK